MLFASILALASLPSLAAGGDIDIPFERFTLDNGLTLIVHEDHSDPVVAVYVFYHVGSGREELGKSGFAHLFEHMLFQGSENVGDDMHFKYVTEAGGTLNGTTNTDRTNYFETLPSNQLELALWLESDRMGFLLPALTQKKLDNQIDVVKNERRQNYENRPYAQAGAAIVAALYPKEHPYSWVTIGSHEDLTKASVDDVKKFFRRWYGPNNATLAIGGDVKTAEVRALVEKYFGSIPRGPAVEMPAPRPVELAATKRLVMEDKVKLSQLVVTWPTVPQFAGDEPALDHLASILAANKSSVLTKALMIDEQLASQVSANEDGQELAGTFSITLRAQSGVSLDVLEEKMQALLTKLATDGVDENAVARAIRRYESEFVRRLEAVSSRTSTLSQYQAFLNRPDAYKEVLERRKSVKAADVTRVLKQYVLGRPAIVMSVVPDKKTDLVAKEKSWPKAIDASAPIVVVKKIAPGKPADSVLADKSVAAPKTVELDRTKRPAPAPTPAFRSPVIWHDRLDNKLEPTNGLALAGTVWKELPLSTLSISVPAGRKRETMATLGISSFTAAMLQQGTQALSAVAYAEELDRLGVNLSVSADDDEIVLRLSCLDAQFSDATKLLADVILHPRFEAADFTRLKKERMTAIETRGDQIRVIAGDVFDRLLRGASSVLGYSSLGTKATSSALTLENVKQFWKTHGVPSRARLAYVGPLDAAKLKKALAPLAESWTGISPPAPAAVAIETPATARVFLVDKPGAAQSEIRIGHMGPSSKDAEWYPLTALNYTLGGAFTSRINMNLREDKGYTYGVRSNVEGGVDAGPLAVSGSFKTDVTAESVVELMKELNGILPGIKTDELTFTKDAISQSARRQYETTMALLGLVDNIGKYGWPDDYPARRLQELDHLSVVQLKDLGVKWVHPDHMVIVVVGDKSKVKDKLDKLGYGPVIELDNDGNPLSGG